MRLFFCTLLLLLPSSIWAACTGSDLRDQLTEQQRQQLTEQIDGMPYARGTHWIARRGSRTVHVIGTLHVNDSRMPQLSQQLAPVIRKADLLLLEVTPAEKSDFERTLSLSPELTLITEGPSLIDRLPPAEWEDLAQQLRNQGIPPWMGAKMQPWFLAMSLAIPRCVVLQKDYKNGLDMRLAAVAQTAGVAMQSLEDPMDVIRMMVRDPLEEQVRQLRAQTAMLGGGMDPLTTMVESYFDQDVLTALYVGKQIFMQTQQQDASEAEALWERTMTWLLEERNRNWIPVIEAAKGDTIVVAAGALHLPGQMGVLKLLEQQGYALTRASQP